MLEILVSTPTHISSTPFPTLLRQHLPKQFVDSSIFGTYNTACTFIKHMKYDKAELVEVEDMLKKPTHKCDVCKTGAKLATTSAPPSSTEIGVEEAHEDVQSPQPPLLRTEADLHTLHKGHGFTKNMWILVICRDGPTRRSYRIGKKGIGTIFLGYIKFISCFNSKLNSTPSHSPW